jgi:hypothetical protein
MHANAKAFGNYSPTLSCFARSANAQYLFDSEFFATLR